MAGLIVVTGGRNYGDYAHVSKVLDEEQPDAVIQGECPYGGADLLAAQYCEERGIPCAGVKAPFRKQGRAAGPIRNGWMLTQFGQIKKVVAFPGDRGTANCVAQAKALGLLVRDEREVRP